MRILFWGVLALPLCSFADTCINLSGDFIYWRVQEEGLGFAETGSTTTFDIIGINVEGSGSDHEPNFRFEPGFKVGLGLNFGCDNWDLFAQYTWLRTDTGTASVSRDPDNITNTLKNKWHVKGAFPIRNLIFASANWKLNFNVIDLELGRAFCPTPCIKLRPFIGFKGAWFDDDLDLHFQLNDPNFPAVRSTNETDYWGIGIRVGINSNWYICDNFFLFGDFAITALRSRYEIDRKDRTTPNAAAPNTTFLERDTVHDFYTIKDVLEFAIGLGYDTWWCDCDYHFSIQAGWEEQLWINHNKHYVLIEDYSLGDLTLHGLTVRVSFGF